MYPVKLLNSNAGINNLCINIGNAIEMGDVFMKQYKNLKCSNVASNVVSNFL